MTPQHLDLVQRVHREQPPDGSPESNLAFLLRLVRALPLAEQVGLHRRPGPPAENVALYNGDWVGVSRVMYPDGLLIKVLSDAGPGGANAPAWNNEGPIDPDRYVAVDATPPPPPPPTVTRVTYDQLINPPDPMANQIAHALDQYRRGWAPTDLAHFFWQLCKEDRPLIDILNEIRGR